MDVLKRIQKEIERVLASETGAGVEVTIRWVDAADALHLTVSGPPAEVAKVESWAARTPVLGWLCTGRAHDDEAQESYTYYSVAKK